jgi:Ca-activated chloride channel family protein
VQRGTGIMKSLSLAICLAAAACGQDVTQGTLRGARAECPLRHTTVKADISAMMARVDLVQEFQNPLSETIEAVYTFPLPHDAAVDDMTMTVGGRTIRGTIKSREQAQALYESARSLGRTAAVLHQQRPNIFTQAVANILPGANIKIAISYVQTLGYEDGNYEFVFPMVVGPRYIPGAKQVPDSAEITPPITPQGTRAGHDVSVEVTLDAGVPIGSMESKTHEIDVERRTPSQAMVRLRDAAVIPNKDFILRYDSPGQNIQEAVMAHRSVRGGYFTLVLQPPARTGVEDATPKELIFVLDTSGSMRGFPIEKAKEAMKLALDGLNPRDTFNLITFSGDTEILFPQPVAATPENLQFAQLFLQSRSGAGGTEMMQAIRAALAPSVEAGRVRVVCFMTDGEVGNDMEILAEVRKHPDARVFAFGIGQSVNRFLLDGMAMYGRGEVEYVGLKDDGSAAARRFHQRVRDPLMTDISIDWAGLPVADVYPRRIPDLFGAKPVIVTGRYTGPAHGMARLRGRVGGADSVRDVALDLPAAEARHDVVATLWARRRVADLMSRDLSGVQAGTMRNDLRRQITQLGLDHRLMTQFTSFVAVEETVVTASGRPRRVNVPVEMPEGMSYEGVGRGSGGGVGYGSGAGLGGGVYRALTDPSIVPKGTAQPVAADKRKLDPALVALLDATGKPPSVEVVVLLRDASSSTIASLQQLGFEILQPPGSGLQTTGRIPVRKLAELSNLSAVRYIVRPR